MYMHVLALSVPNGHVLAVSVPNGHVLAVGVPLFSLFLLPWLYVNNLKYQMDMFLQ